MLYYIILGGIVIFPLIWIWGIYSYNYDGEKTCTGVFGTVICCVWSLFLWLFHADDLTTVAYQDKLIEVREEQVVRLKDTLQNISQPSQAILVNHDLPIASIVEKLSETEQMLTWAKEEKTKAIKDIEARRIGPFSGVIVIHGDYK